VQEEEKIAPPVQAPIAKAAVRTPPPPQPVDPSIDDIPDDFEPPEIETPVNVGDSKISLSLGESPIRDTSE
jgi:hypothetical protein